MGQYKNNRIDDSTGVQNIGLSPTGVTFPAGIATNGLQVVLSTTASSPFNFSTSDNIRALLVNFSSGIVNLPTTASSAGRTITIKKIHATSGAVVVTPASGLIDGASTYSLNNQQYAATFICDGTNWHTFNGVDFISASRTSNLTLANTQDVWQNITSLQLTVPAGTWRLCCDGGTLSGATTAGAFYVSGAIRQGSTVISAVESGGWQASASGGGLCSLAGLNAIVTITTSTVYDVSGLISRATGTALTFGGFEWRLNTVVPTSQTTVTFYAIRHN